TGPAFRQSSRTSSPTFHPCSTSSPESSSTNTEGEPSLPDSGSLPMNRSRIEEVLSQGVSSRSHDHRTAVGEGQGAPGSLLPLRPDRRMSIIRSFIAEQGDLRVQTRRRVPTGALRVDQRSGLFRPLLS